MLLCSQSIIMPSPRRCGPAHIDLIWNLLQPQRPGILLEREASSECTTRDFLIGQDLNDNARRCSTVQKVHRLDVHELWALSTAGRIACWRQPCRVSLVPNLPSPQDLESSLVSGDPRQRARSALLRYMLTTARTSLVGSAQISCAAIGVLLLTNIGQSKISLSASANSSLQGHLYN